MDYGKSCWQTNKDSAGQTCGFLMTIGVRFVKTDSALIPTSEDLCANIVNVAKENSQDFRNIQTFLGNKDKNDDENRRGYAQKVEFNQSTIKTATPVQIMQMCRKCQDHPYCSVQVQLIAN